MEGGKECFQETSALSFAFHLQNVGLSAYYVVQMEPVTLKPHSHALRLRGKPRSRLGRRKRPVPARGRQENRAIHRNKYLPDAGWAQSPVPNTEVQKDEVSPFCPPGAVPDNLKRAPHPVNCCRISDWRDGCLLGRQGEVLEEKLSEREHPEGPGP